VFQAMKIQKLSTVGFEGHSFTGYGKLIRHGFA
jgi:hypothetical protein